MIVEKLEELEQHHPEALDVGMNSFDDADVAWVCWTRSLLLAPPRPHSPQPATSIPSRLAQTRSGFLIISTRCFSSSGVERKVLRCRENPAHRRRVPGTVDHAGAAVRPQPDRSSIPGRRGDRHRTTQPGGHCAGRGDATAHPWTRNPGDRPLANAKAMNPTASTGPNPLRASRDIGHDPDPMELRRRARQPRLAVLPTAQRHFRPAPVSRDVAPDLYWCARTQHAARGGPLRRWLFPGFPHRPQDYAHRLEIVREAASDAGRDPTSLVPAVMLAVTTGRNRDDVDEALESEVIKASALQASDEVFSRHSAQHPLGLGFSGVQDLSRHINSSTAATRPSRRPSTTRRRRSRLLRHRAG